MVAGINKGTDPVLSVFTSSAIKFPLEPWTDDKDRQIGELFEAFLREDQERKLRKTTPAEGLNYENQLDLDISNILGIDLYIGIHGGREGKHWNEQNTKENLQALEELVTQAEQFGRQFPEARFGECLNEGDPLTKKAAPKSFARFLTSSMFTSAPTTSSETGVNILRALKVRYDEALSIMADKLIPPSVTSPSLQEPALQKAQRVLALVHQDPKKWVRNLDKTKVSTSITESTLAASQFSNPQKDLSTRGGLLEAPTYPVISPSLFTRKTSKTLMPKTDPLLNWVLETFPTEYMVERSIELERKPEEGLEEEPEEGSEEESEEGLEEESEKGSEDNESITTEEGQFFIISGTLITQVVEEKPVPKSSLEPPLVPKPSFAKSVASSSPPVTQITLSASGNESIDLYAAAESIYQSALSRTQGAIEKVVSFWSFIQKGWHDASKEFWERQRATFIDIKLRKPEANVDLIEIKATLRPPSFLGSFFNRKPTTDVDLCSIQKNTQGIALIISPPLSEPVNERVQQIEGTAIATGVLVGKWHETNPNKQPPAIVINGGDLRCEDVLVMMEQLYIQGTTFKIHRNLHNACQKNSESPETLAKYNNFISSNNVQMVGTTPAEVSLGNVHSPAMR